MFFGALDDWSNDTIHLTCDVPHGSVLGPILFSLQMLLYHSVVLPEITAFIFFNYADKNQLYISKGPNDYSSVNNLTTCISDLLKASYNWIKLREKLFDHLKSFSHQGTGQAP